jgi:hypothetical protein
MPELPYTADPVPATPIGDMKDWQLQVRCARCGRHTVLALDYVARRHGLRRPVIDVTRHLQCNSFYGQEKCRGRPRLVTLVKVATYGKVIAHPAQAGGWTDSLAANTN